jgi:hypothetical protein
MMGFNCNFERQAGLRIFLVFPRTATRLDV